MLGRTWNADLDCSVLGPGVATLSARRWAIDGRPSGMGEVLIDGPLVFRAAILQSGGVRRFGWSVPFDLALCGLEVHVQGACRTIATGAVKPGLARTRLSNALDLVLGL